MNGANKIGALILGAFVIAAVGGCSLAREEQAKREGHSVKVDSVIYNVQFTRQLTPGDAEDSAYLVGLPELKADEAYLGVFVRIENDGDRGYRPPRGINVVDSEQREFQALNGKSVFALDFADEIPAGEQAPKPDSPASNGVAGGELVIFKVLKASFQSLPLELEIPARSGEAGRIELDI